MKSSSRRVALLRVVAFTFFFFLSFSAFTVDASGAEVFKWRLQALGPRGSTETDVVVRFAEQVKLASNGRLDITVYGGDEIVPTFESFDAVSRGLLEMHCTDPSYWMGKTNNCSGITTIPYLFPTILDHKVFLDYKGALDIIREVYAKQNIHLINIFRIGEGTIWAKFPFSKIEDLKGKKIRAHGLWANALDNVGIPTVSMPAGEVYQGVERGVIDGIVTANIAWCYDFGFHEVAKYVFASESNNVSNLEFAVNMDAWNKLPPDLKAIVTICAKEAEFEMLARNHDWDMVRLAEIKEKWGVEEQELDEASRDKIREMMMPKVDEFSKDDATFAKLGALLKDYLKVIGK